MKKDLPKVATRKLGVILVQLKNGAQTNKKKTKKPWLVVILWPAGSLHYCWLTVRPLSVGNVADNNSSSKAALT